jgi:hypothetical protein
MFYRLYHIAMSAISNQWFDPMARHLTTEVDGLFLGLSI